MNISSKVALAAAISAFLMGITIVLSRSIIDQIGPGSLAMLRYLVALLVLLPFFLTLSKIRIPTRDLLKVCLIGVFQFGVVISLLNFALQYVPAGRAALIFSIAPFIAMFLSALLGREQLSWIKSAGVALTIVGVGFALGERIWMPIDPTTGWVGEVAILGAAFFFAACSVLYRPYLEKYSILPVSIFALISSVIFLFIISTYEGFWSHFHLFDVNLWLAVLLIGLCSCSGYYLWLWALERTTATHVVVYLALNPITALGFGAIFQNEPITLLFLLGLVFVAIGLFVMQKSP